MSRESKLLTLALLIVMLCTCWLPAFAEGAAGANVPEGYKLVAENSRFNLYLQETTMAVVIERKDNGAVMYSTVQNPNTGNATWKGFYQSGIVIEYLEDVKDKAIQADLINNANTIEYTYGENAFTAHITFTDLGIAFDVKVSMDEEGMHVAMDEASIVETKDEVFLIALNDAGEEERIDLTKYTKTAEETEYVLYTADGKSVILNKTYYVSGKEDNVTVKNVEGTAQMTVPLAEGTKNVFNIQATDAAGKAVEVDPTTITGVQKNLYLTGTGKDGTALRIPKDRVVSVSEYSYTIASVFVYPYMGHSRAGEGQGYMIIPDGQGAVVGFENNEGRYSTPYDKPVYGVNIGVEDQAFSEARVLAEDVLAPFFGMVHTDSGIAVLGVIEEGDIAARIQAYPNGVRNLPFDWVTAKYTYRFVFQQPMGPGSGNVATRNEHRRNFDIRQHFLLECGETADYAGLAAAYRSYLIANNTFAQAEDRPFDVQVDFLGMERENFILGKQDVAMTTFEQAGEILSELKAENVEHISAVYRGWQTNGLTGGVPTDSYSPAGSLGGKKGLAQLCEKVAEMGYNLSLETDLLSLNIETHPALTFSAFKKITSQTWSKPTFGKVYATLNYLTPATTRDIGMKLIDALNKAEIKGVAFTGITQLLSDYYHQDKYHDTSEMAEHYEAVISKANETMSTNLISANAYLWKHANVLSDLPIAGSDYTYTDAEIPFLTIALSGQIPYYVEYTNFQANTQEFFLHLVEQGARPSFLLTMEDPIELQNSNSSNIYSSRYDLYKTLIVEWYAELNALYETVGADGMIVDHVRSGDMVCVTWSNGTKVYLNFGDYEGTMDGVTLAKMSYEVVNGNGN
ncbi:MAG: hypothetical protein E7327_01015 [Clostridiales bacterium]|nr:hypothetical protein [Clostridiales bacterium]